MNDEQCITFLEGVFYLGIDRNFRRANKWRMSQRHSHGTAQTNIGGYAPIKANAASKI